MTSPSPDLLEAADLIERFVSGAVDPWEWDDFISDHHRNSTIDKLSREVIAVQADFPPEHSGQWCSELGRQRLLEIASRARSGAQT